jgi:hypothetical protein
MDVPEARVSPTQSGGLNLSIVLILTLRQRRVKKDGGLSGDARCRVGRGLQFAHSYVSGEADGEVVFRSGERDFDFADGECADFLGNDAEAVCDSANGA